MGILTGKQGNNQYGLLPFGMEPELRPQMFPILIKDMECGELNAILGEVSDSFASSSILLGPETE